MARRGLTLIEMLLALTVLGGLCALLISWVATIARLSAVHGPATQWRAAAIHVLDSIGDDLSCGDFEVPDRSERSTRPRVVVRSQRLLVRTRGTPSKTLQVRGPTRHEYLLDSGRQTLTLRVFSSAEARLVETRTLLSHVDGWSVQNDEGEQALTVMIRSVDGQQVSRRYEVW